MYCNYCGKVIQDDAYVCAYCGKRVAAVIARKRLVRPQEGRRIAGVCQGLAQFFDLDVTAIRLVWVLSIFLALPFSIIGYFVAWIVVPEEPLRLMPPAPATAQQVHNH